jgi:microcystin-dependent protein
MSDPYLSEIRMMAFNFAPKGWALCNGQTLGISQNTALFSLIGTTYGGDGITNFKLPNLQGQVPMHFDDTFALGQVSGEATHTLIPNEMPRHTHLMMATAATGAGNTPPGPLQYLAQGHAVPGGAQVNMYSTATASRNFSQSAVSNAGNSQPHENRHPYLVINFCIAMQGIYPSRS